MDPPQRLGFRTHEEEVGTKYCTHKVSSLRTPFEQAMQLTDSLWIRMTVSEFPATALPICSLDRDIYDTIIPLVPLRLNKSEDCFEDLDR